MGGGQPTSYQPELVDDSDEASSIASSDWFVRHDSADDGDSLSSWRSDGIPRGPDSSVLRRSRRCSLVYESLLRSYGEAIVRSSQYLHQSKDIIIRHKPGDWMEEVGGTKLADYEIPAATTLLLVGPRGSGKSTLINRITEVFDDGDPFAIDRAQVSYNLSATIGTCFLQEYMIPRNSKSLCIYDTRSLSMNASENHVSLRSWMIEGVSHGEKDIRESDDAETRDRIEAMAADLDSNFFYKRRVNFVILVVDGVSVQKAIFEKDKQYRDLIFQIFNYPEFSFKDDKPIVVITHGEELTLPERANVREYLGELLGIPPLEQIFDIPATRDYGTNLAIVDMLRAAIVRADRNIPAKWSPPVEEQIYQYIVERLPWFALIVEVLVFCVAMAILWVRLLQHYMT